MPKILFTEEEKRERKNKAQRSYNLSDKGIRNRKNYSFKNKDKINKKAKEWRLVNLEKARRYDKKRSRLRVEYTKFNRWKKYNFNKQDFDNLLIKQNNFCAICSTKEPRGFGNTWHIDHDHKTNLVRGLLCTLCNTGLGKFKDNPNNFTNAIRYIKNPPNLDLKNNYLNEEFERELW